MARENWAGSESGVRLDLPYKLARTCPSVSLGKHLGSCQGTSVAPRLRPDCGGNNSGSFHPRTFATVWPAEKFRNQEKPSHSPLAYAQMVSELEALPKGAREHLGCQNRLSAWLFRRRSDPHDLRNERWK